ncbi:MAG: alpha-L-glutamate ligase, partial [Halobacteriales archaeon]|nr:alpha-L-glutamate ligase [Halobacteriales archaeon]
MAVATAAETLERLHEPLTERGITAEHLQTRYRSISLQEPIDGFDVGFVFPPRVVEGGVAAALTDIPWVNDQTAVLRSRNKAEVIARLSRVGLPVPDTVLVSDPIEESDLRAVFTAFDGPVVVKPTTTTRGVGVARADDLDSFLGICDYVGLIHAFPATGDRSFLVQEFLPGARDIRVMVLD